MELADRIIVITGGASGIGEALARAATAEGARHVVVADRDADGATRVAGDIGGTGVALDVRDGPAIAELVERVEAEQGPVDVFVSNAGFVTAGGLEEADEILQTMWEVHVMAHVHAARAVVPSMIARGEGYLLNVASAAGLLTQLGSMGYSVTKHAAVGLAEWLAITHHHQGIRVTVACPQAVATNILRNNPTQPLDADLGDGAASVDGVITADEVAAECIAAIREERFWALPHPEVGEYARRKADDVDRWLAGMRRLQGKLYPEGALPGDAIVR